MKSSTVLNLALLGLGLAATATAQQPAVADAGNTTIAPAASAPAATNVVPAPNALQAQKNADGTYDIIDPTNPGATAPAKGLAKGKAKKPPVSAGGTWKWTTYNLSLQPCENVLTLTVGKNGKISGKLIDRTGEHEIKDATLGDGVVTFELKFHTRGEGDLPHTYTVNLDPDNLEVSVDRPDLTPFGKSHGGKHQSKHAAKHDANG